MSKNPDKLTPAQERAILALLTSPSVADAARAAKLSAPTLFRWLKEEAFDRAYMDARREATRQAVAQLQQIGGKAVKTLADVMEDSSAPASARVTAAKSVLELSMKAVEFEDLARRVEELEQYIEATKAKKG